MRLAEPLLQQSGPRMLDQHEKPCSTDPLEPCSIKRRIEAGSPLEDTGRNRPGVALHQRFRDGQRRAGDGPGTEPIGKGRKHRLRRDDEAEAQTGEPEELAEGAEDDEVAFIAHMAGDAQLRLKIAEGFVDQQQPAVCLLPRRHRQKFGGREGTASRVVGVYHDDQGMLGAERSGIFDAIDGKAGCRQHTGIFAIGRPEDRDAPVRRRLPVFIYETRQKLDRRLGARHRQRQHAIGAVIICGCQARVIHRLPIRQPMPRAFGYWGQGDGARIDTGRKIEPVFEAPAKARRGLGDAAAVDDRCAHGAPAMSMRCMKEPATLPRLRPAWPRSSPAASLTENKRSAAPSATMVA
ncbi:hypothetical protein D9M70_470450 [compost metagenome]